MKHKKHKQQSHEGLVAEREQFIQEALATIPLPAFTPPTAEVLAHRRKVAAEINRFRTSLGPEPFPVSEWTREDRDGGASDNG